MRHLSFLSFSLCTCLVVVPYYFNDRKLSCNKIKKGRRKRLMSFYCDVTLPARPGRPSVTLIHANVSICLQGLVSTRLGKIKWRQWVWKKGKGEAVEMKLSKTQKKKKIVEKLNSGSGQHHHHCRAATVWCGGRRDTLASGRLAPSNGPRKFTLSPVVAATAAAAFKLQVHTARRRRQRRRQWTRNCHSAYFLSSPPPCCCCCCCVDTHTTNSLERVSCLCVLQE